MIVESDLSEIISRDYTLGSGTEAPGAAACICPSVLKTHSSQWFLCERVIIIQWLLQKDHIVL